MMSEYHQDREESQSQFKKTTWRPKRPKMLQTGRPALHRALGWEWKPKADRVCESQDIDYSLWSTLSLKWALLFTRQPNQRNTVHLYSVVYTAFQSWQSCWRISDINVRLVRGEVLLGSVPLPSAVKQMCGQMPWTDGQSRFESMQPVAKESVTWPRAGWPDTHKTPRNQVSSSGSPILRVCGDMFTSS